MKQNLFFAVFVGVFLTAPNGLSGQTATCMASDDFSQRAVASIQLLMSTDLSVERNAIGLSKVNPSEVVVESDPTVCTRGRLAMDSLAHAWNAGALTPPTTGRAIYVIHIGDAYCVFNPYVPSKNSYDFLFYFRDNWQFLNMRAL